MLITKLEMTTELKAVCEFSATTIRIDVKPILKSEHN